MSQSIVLNPGEQIAFLDYVILNSGNGTDGLVLRKESGGKLYETHLGNYGIGTQANIDLCKRYALLYFMAARPQNFATKLVRRAMSGSVTFHEWGAFLAVCKRENIAIPKEVGHSADGNRSIQFKGRPIISK